MKRTFIVSVLLSVPFTMFAIMLRNFPGYDWLREHSSDVVLAHCVSNPPTSLHYGSEPDLNTFSLETIAVLKGTNFLKSFSLVTMQWLNQGDDYLIFGNLENGACRAIEKYRVIPEGRELGLGILTNSIARKSPDEQLQVLYERAIFSLDRQIKEEQEAKARLETAIKK
jgi:hypothetical protein